MNKEIQEVIGGEFGVLVRYTPQSHVINFRAVEIVSYDDNDKSVPVFAREGSSTPLDNPTKDINDAERYVEGSVKWDGCSHYYFGDDSAYIHLCGGSAVQQLASVIAAIHKRCGALLKEQGNILEDEFEGGQGA